MFLDELGLGPCSSALKLLQRSFEKLPTWNFLMGFTIGNTWYQSIPPKRLPSGAAFSASEVLINIAENKLVAPGLYAHGLSTLGAAPTAAAPRGASQSPTTPERNGRAREMEAFHMKSGREGGTHVYF